MPLNEVEQIFYLTFSRSFNWNHTRYRLQTNYYKLLSAWVMQAKTHAHTNQRHTLESKSWQFVNTVWL